MLDLQERWPPRCVLTTQSAALNQPTGLSVHTMVAMVTESKETGSGNLQPCALFPRKDTLHAVKSQVNLYPGHSHYKERQGDVKGTCLHVTLTRRARSQHPGIYSLPTTVALLIAKV